MLEYNPSKNSSRRRERPSTIKTSLVALGAACTFVALGAAKCAGQAEGSQHREPARTATGEFCNSDYKTVAESALKRAGFTPKDGLEALSCNSKRKRATLADISPQLAVGVNGAKDSFCDAGIASFNIHGNKADFNLVEFDGVNIGSVHNGTAAEGYRAAQNSPAEPVVKLADCRP